MANSPHQSLIDECPRCGGVVGADTCEDCAWPQPPVLVPQRYVLFVGGKWVRVQKTWTGWVAHRSDQYVGKDGKWAYKQPASFATPEEAAEAALRAPVSWVNDEGREVGGDGWWSSDW